MTSDDRHSRIENALRAVWREQGRRFVTIEDAQDDERFVQFLDGVLNVSWPDEDDPRELLPRLGAAPPRGVRILDWTPGRTAVLHTGDLRLDATVAYVERLIDRVLGADTVHVRVEADR